MPQAIIIFGPPGSGKSTQANLLARRVGGIHVDTGRLLEEDLASGPSTPATRKRRKQFASGELVDPAWVFRMLERRVRAIRTAGFSVIFSGSPRTAYEADRMMPLLERLYGAQNIHPILLEVSEATSLKRNSARRVCPFCDLPSVMPHLRTCALCLHSLKRRSIDTPTIIRRRLVEYRERTQPIFDIVKRSGYHIARIDGNHAPYQVVTKIVHKIAR